MNLLQLAPGEKITAMIPIHEYSDDKNLFMVTTVSYTHLDVYKRQIRKIQMKNSYAPKKVVVPGKTLNEVSKICLLYTSRCV